MEKFYIICPSRAMKLILSYQRIFVARKTVYKRKKQISFLNLLEEVAQEGNGSLFVFMEGDYKSAQLHCVVFQVILDI